MDWRAWWRYLGESRRGVHDEYDTEQEPYMVTVQASHVSGDTALFDSEHRHQGYIALRIHSAYRDRSLGRDWISSDKELIEVTMSFAQWASMISTMNHGSGTPATLTHVLHHRVQRPVAAENRTEKFGGEVMACVQSAIDSIDEMLSGRLTKAQKSQLHSIRQEILSNMPFMAEQFGRHMETRVEKAKSDIEAHMNMAVQRVGIAALSQSERLAGLLEQNETKT